MTLRHRMFSLWFVMALLLWASAWGQAAPGFQSGAGSSLYRVRVAYIIPSDRQPIARYHTKAGMLLSGIQTFYADQMERNGFGRMTFAYEADAEGLPEVHVLRSPMTAAEFAGTGHAKYALGNYWQHTEAAIKAAGFPPYRPGEIWLCIVEAQDQLPDGSIHNGTSQGNCVFESGMVLCSADILALADPKLLHDHRSYDGLIVPEIGPNRLVLHKSFADYEGDAVSSLVAVHIGALAHELGHAFTLQHCYLNDLNFNGNLMGNSFRGWRGSAMPEQFPHEETRLDRPSALMLRINPFFRKPTERVPEGKPPVVTITAPPGNMPIEGGRFRLPFTVSQPGGPGIALAILQCAEPQDNVGVVAYQGFEGTDSEVADTLETTLITPGKEQHWTVRVFDKQGRWGEQTILLKAPTDGIAAVPFLSIPHTTVKVGETVKFDAGLSRPGMLRYHWDFGDGREEDGQVVPHPYKKPGHYNVKLTVLDSAGRHSEGSQFIWVRPAKP
jgi:hypothetical protein